MTSKHLRTRAGAAITLVTLLLGTATGGFADQSAVKLENLMRTDLDVAADLEIIVSRVEIGPNLSLPSHYHPGEEFIYVLDGSATLWQKGQPDVVLKAGDVYRIPLEQIHTAITGETSTTAIVFRVHRKGEPERIPAE